MSTLAINPSNMQELSIDEQRQIDGGNPYLIVLGVVAVGVVLVCAGSFAYGYYQGRKSKR